MCFFFFFAVHALGADEHQRQNAARRGWRFFVGFRGVQKSVRGRSELGREQNKMGRQVERGHHKQISQLRDLIGVPQQQQKKPKKPKKINSKIIPSSIKTSTIWSTWIVFDDNDRTSNLNSCDIRVLTSRAWEAYPVHTTVKYKYCVVLKTNRINHGYNRYCYA